MDFDIEDVKLALARWCALGDDSDEETPGLDPEDVDWNQVTYMWSEGSPLETPFGKLWEVNHEGGEGQGEYAEVIFTVDGRRFFRKTGSYYSYDGYWWDGPFREVFPKQKTITVYEEAA